MLQNKLEKEITSLAGYGVTLFGENSKWKFRWLLKQQNEHLDPGAEAADTI